MSETALNRLKHERSEWRKTHPFGFVAKPMQNLDGSLNYRFWKCRIPGLRNTPWDNGSYYIMYMAFPENYPIFPPICKFSPQIFHPNVHPINGTMNISLLDENIYWNPIYTIKHILSVIQLVLNEPSLLYIVNELAFSMYCSPNRSEYDDIIKEQARRMLAFVLNQ